MTIENERAYLDNIWNHAIWNGCFGDTKISPTDVDGLVERNGYFLLLEFKAPRATIGTGQRLAQDSLLATGAFTVMNIWGHPDHPEKIEIRTWRKNFEIQEIDLDGARDKVETWYKHINSRPPFPGKVDTSLLQKKIYHLEDAQEKAKALLVEAIEVLTH